MPVKFLTQLMDSFYFVHIHSGKFSYKNSEFCGKSFSFLYFCRKFTKDENRYHNRFA